MRFSTRWDGNMRYGFTTGSCAAAAAKAAAYMLLTGKEKKSIVIDTPKGIPYQASVLHIIREEKRVSCAVEKDGGDDPDITTGALIYAEAEILKEREGSLESVINIDGGTGVGRVTKQGLDQPVGNAAINRVPRKMIEKEVAEVCRMADFAGVLSVIISTPKGEELARKTFNPRLGIIGGISILGTTGIVEPMSTQALLATIQAELSVKKAEGYRLTAVTPGNYGLQFMETSYGYDLDQSVKCSNYIGETIDMAADLGFESLLLTGHIGKLVKLSGGIMNTHSKEGDCRMELFAAAGISAGLSGDTAREILGCATSEAAIEVLKKAGKRDIVMKVILKKACMYLNKRAADRLAVECIMYSNEAGELAKSAGAEELLERIKLQGAD